MTPGYTPILCRLEMTPIVSSQWVTAISIRRGCRLEMRRNLNENQTRLKPWSTPKIGRGARHRHKGANREIGGPRTPERAVTPCSAAIVRAQTGVSVPLKPKPPIQLSKSGRLPASESGRELPRRYDAGRLRGDRLLAARSVSDQPVRFDWRAGRDQSGMPMRFTSASKRGSPRRFSKIG